MCAFAGSGCIRGSGRDRCRKRSQPQKGYKMEKKAKTLIIALFVIRILLWITALVSTIYWIWYSNHLYKIGIFDPYEYGPIFRPVFYTCLAISVTAVCIAFALHAWTVKIKKQMDKDANIGPNVEEINR